MEHLRNPDGTVEHWYLSRLDADAMASGDPDPDLVDRSTRGHRIVGERIARTRAEDGWPPVRRSDPHKGHQVSPDEHGVIVCWTCTGEEG
jgi:hypothetical protein